MNDLKYNIMKNANGLMNSIEIGVTKEWHLFGVSTGMLLKNDAKGVHELLKRYEDLGAKIALIRPLEVSIKMAKDINDFCNGTGDYA